jgi:hypothetical protein
MKIEVKGESWSSRNFPDKIRNVSEVFVRSLLD